MTFGTTAIYNPKKGANTNVTIGVRKLLMVFVSATVEHIPASIVSKSNSNAIGTATKHDDD